MLDQGEIVTNKHLGQALADIQKMQIARDRDLLASKRLTNPVSGDHRTVRLVIFSKALGWHEINRTPEDYFSFAYC